MKLVVGLAGASGSIYAARFLKALFEIEGETYITASPASLRIFSEEYETTVKTTEDILSFVEEKWQVKPKHKFHVRNFIDIGSDIASGSNVWDAMVVIPCSMKTVASMSAGLTENLIERAADVTLKERRRLIVVPRETPYNRIHLRNMLALDEAGAILLPASPGFYQMPKTLDDLGDFITGRILNLLGVPQTLFPKWEG
ncbi:UbiX family flavin prenyltransferase [Leptospira levettii]|uniref:UbiX family flavin prenyltransferase n=1 Tax=Leptospira levettii TaxID=2023178 RepID=UPI00223D3C7F|nr:UbiX family flavin prenyltransferase [Leptospira levettii]MCW7473316.1 UbiX family flavin prenyltransferase [Leptospira levettii]